MISIKLMTPRAGVGADLREILTRELNIPRTAKWFEVRFASDGPVTVKCEFHAEEQPESGGIPDEDGPELHAPSYGGLNG